MPFAARILQQSAIYGLDFGCGQLQLVECQFPIWIDVVTTQRMYSCIVTVQVRGRKRETPERKRRLPTGSLGFMSGAPMFLRQCLVGLNTRRAG